MPPENLIRVGPRITEIQHCRPQQLRDATLFGAGPQVLTAREFEKAARSRLEVVKGKAFSDGEKMQINNGNGWMVEGHSDHFVKRFNSLVESSNRIDW